MGCNNKMSNVCVDSTSSKCIDYKGKLGNSSSITDECVSQFEVNEDLYDIVNTVEDSQNTSELGSLCLTYPVTEGKVLPKSVYNIHEQEICTLKNKVEILENKTLEEIDISQLGLNFQCLVDPCGDPITNLKTLLQLLINKSCNV